MGRNLFGWVLFIGLAIMLFMLLNKGQSMYASVPIDEFTTRLKNDRVQVVTVETDRLIGEFRQPEPLGNQGQLVQRFQVQLPAGTTQNWSFMQWLLDNRQNTMVRVENNPNWLLQVIIPLIPWLLIFGFIWFFVFRNLRKMQTVNPNAARPVYFVPPPPGQPMPAPPLATMHPPPQSPPSTPAPGGDN
jgi:ATP-dependent Zn protease